MGRSLINSHVEVLSSTHIKVWGILLMWHSFVVFHTKKRVSYSSFRMPPLLNAWMQSKKMVSKFFLEGVIDYCSDFMHSPHWTSILGEKSQRRLRAKLWLWMMGCIRCTILLVTRLLNVSRLVVLSLINKVNISISIDHKQFCASVMLEWYFTGLESWYHTV